MREGGHHLGFMLELHARRRIAAEFLRQHLDGHIAVQPGIARAIHVPHTPGPESGDDPVLA
jgi:hypothetical protein